MSGVDTSAPPGGTGCAECEDTGGWWFHLRRCAQCGHIGCCDSSPSRHARAHAAAEGHPVMRSFEPGETWFWDFTTERDVEGPNSPRRTRTPPISPYRVRAAAYRPTGAHTCTDPGTCPSLAVRPTGRKAESPEWTAAPA